ncbi:hypothetical protein Tco_1069811 [Tanacetum coccineum]|uniref:Uncharacterized protein n=1 Tax=Tanacetum coccineum TaxID=301880 RepID=A0ABQ5HKZ7_9ASTR
MSMFSSTIKIYVMSACLCGYPCADKMADENVPAPANTRSDDQILLFAAWVPIGKSNYIFDLQKKQKNPIFHISVASVHSLPQPRFQLSTFNNFGTRLHMRQRMELTVFSWMKPDSQDSGEEFVQAIQTFLTDTANLGSPTKKGRK